jgi:hypothetical protein
MPCFGPTVDTTTRKRAAFLTQARYQAGEVDVGQADGGFEAASPKAVGDDEHRLNAIAAAISGLRNPGAATLQTAIN